MAQAESEQPVLRSGLQKVDKYGTKLVDKAGEYQSKIKSQPEPGNEKQPAGGFDATPIANAPPGYTIRITFNRAENLPFSDIPTFSSDPYIHATLKTDLQKRHKSDPDLTLRTPTIHRNVNPKWETQWIIAHVPASGFEMKCRIYDEDPADHDDRLGNVHVNVSGISDSWTGFTEKSFSIKKRMGSKRAYTFRGCAALFSSNVSMNGILVVSVENLGRSPGDNGGRAYTVAPLPWSRHHSPLIGMIAGTKSHEEGKDGKKGVERYNFQAVQMQLRGPVPSELYHRYVEFKPFIAGMFTDVTLRGRILNRALHHQHARIYNYDRTTVYGIFEKPCTEMTQQFLEFVHYDQGGRIFTYVLSLDGLWRFTETGKEFGIDMLSKHTMHSDVSSYIAFSGEFLVRKLKHPHKNSEASPNMMDEILPPEIDAENPENITEKSGRPSPTANGTVQEHQHKQASKDPSYYELIIDNDSGTYRPNADLLSQLRDYMSSNLPGLRIVALDGRKDEEKLKKLKKEQGERKKASGKSITYLQNSSVDSFSSSDEEELTARVEGRPKKHGYQKRLEKLRSGSQDHTNDLSNETPVENMKEKTDSNSQKSGNDEGYENKELPDLIKGEGHEQTSKAGEPDKGENMPAGGIAYHRVVSATI